MTMNDFEAYKLVLEDFVRNRAEHVCNIGVALEKERLTHALGKAKPAELEEGAWVDLMLTALDLRHGEFFGLLIKGQLSGLTDLSDDPYIKWVLSAHHMICESFKALTKDCESKEDVANLMRNNAPAVSDAIFHAMMHVYEGFLKHTHTAYQDKAFDPENIKNFFSGDPMVTH